MDITLNNKRLYTTKHMNAESVKYTLTTIISFIILLFIKQMLRLIPGVSVTVSVIVAFAVASVISFILERIYVFSRGITDTPKQIVFFLFRAAVNFGFFKICDFLFGDMLKMQDSFVWLGSALMASVFNYYFDRLIVFDMHEKAIKFKGGRAYKLFFYNRFVLLSMVVAGAGLLMIYFIFSLFPFGTTSIMRMDLYHQYGPLMAELYERITTGSSFLYSWNTSGGSTFIGNFFNYLSSPLSVLVILFDKKDISNAITFIILIKCILSAGAFSYYLKASQHRHSFVTSAFGVFYALSAYFLAYYWNIMWIDAMYILPFVILGIERLINGKKPTLYIVSLALLMFSNYYIGFMACIFSCLYFLTYFSATKQWAKCVNENFYTDKKVSFGALKNNYFVDKLIKFIWSSAIVGLLCAFFLIPVFMILRSSSATTDTFPTQISSYFNLFDFITAHFAALETTIRSSGDDILPNVYCSILAIILVPLYMINRNISLKEKASYIALLLFLVLSFDTNILNFIWHAFHFPNDLPYRFSFMYSFIVLVLAFKGIKNISTIQYKDILYVAFGWIGYILVSQKLINTKMDDGSVYVTLVLIIIWTGVLLLVNKRRFNNFIIGVTIVAMSFCEVMLADSGSFVFSQDNATYSKNYDSVNTANKYINKNDNGFFRTELSDVVVLMSPSYYGYNGMSLFSSMANEKYASLQNNIGMKSNRINSCAYHTQTPVYNMMMGIKYLITDLNDLQSFGVGTEYFTNYYTTADEASSAFKSDYPISLAYCVNKNIDKWDYSEGNPFAVQSEYFELVTGEKKVFVPCQYLDTMYDNISGDQISDTGELWYTKSGDGTSGSIEVKVTPSISGETYIYVTSSDADSIDVSTKDKTVTQSIDEAYILNLGYQTEGEEITVTLDCSDDETTEGNAQVYAYTTDKKVFEAGYNKLKPNELKVTKHNNTSFEGQVKATEDCYLYTSIPYDVAWNVYVDGKKVKTKDLAESMLAVKLSKGTHNVEFKYMPIGVIIGVPISGISIISIAGYCIMKKKKYKKNCDI